MKDAAKEVDNLYHAIMEKITGSHLPRQAGPLTCACCPTVAGLDPGIPGLSITTQQLTTSLPLKLGGFGLRSQEFLSPYAYYGGIEQSVPHFATVCPPLAHLYDRDGDVSVRWQPLLNSGTRMGRELAAAMEKVKEEAAALSNYLGVEEPAMHANEVEAMGQGRVDGSTRALLVREAEKLRADAMDKVLEELPDQGHRAVMVRKNANKLSTAFLLSKPGPHTGIQSIFFSEQLLALLAVPSVLCRGKVGERVGRLTVDQWGDAVLNATLPGNHFTRGHDTLKNALNSLLKYCGILSEVEPYGVFADLVPQQPLNRAEGFRAAQTIIPDIRAELPDELAGTRRTYMEVKTVSGLTRWYKPVRGERAVERRVLAITTEYTSAARAADQKYYQTDAGPITQRLHQISPILGVAFGRFGEASESVHKLVDKMTEARVESQLRAWRRGEDVERPNEAQEKGYIRRRLSTASVTAFGHRLSSRMSQVGGEGAALASQRRKQWSREEEIAKVERAAAWVERITGHDVVRRGRFWAA